MILVLGATGFLGTHVCNKLRERGLTFAAAATQHCDLEDRRATLDFFQEVKPAKVINCAAFVGGIQFVLKRPAEVFCRNMRMALNILEATERSGVERLVNPISNCTYPAKANVFKETEYWDGPMHPNALMYGMPRKALWVGSWAYNIECGTDIISLILPNMYGPYDHLDEERSHALGGMLTKILEAQEKSLPQVSIWGTGSPIREWLYGEDGAEAMVRALTCTSQIDPVNIGVGSGISIADLARQIKNAVGYEGELVFDTRKPDGAHCKIMDGKAGADLLGYQPNTDLATGLAATIKWYRGQKGAAVSRTKQK